MWRSFVRWLDEYLAETGVAGLIQGGVGILGFGAALSALLGYSAVKGAAVVAALLLGLGLALTLVGSRARWRRRCERRDELIDLYSRALFDNGTPWRLLQWRQTMHLDANGDTRARIEVHAVSEHAALPFFRLKLGAGWNMPIRLRKRVTVCVRSLEVAGVGGTRCEFQQAWRKDGLLDVVVMFPAPALLDQQFHVVVEVFWPGRCTPLTVDRRPDQFVVKVGPLLELLEYTVELPPDMRAFYDRVGFGMDEPGFELFSRNTPSGRSEVCLRAKDIREERRVGMRLDLK